MREFVLMTDSDSEIPYYFAEEYDIPVFLMPYTLNGKEDLFDLGKTTDFDGFYKALRGGADASTSTRSVLDIQEFFEEELKKGKDILYLCFSSQLSGHYNLSLMAREEALKNYPDARIEIVDTLSISLGAGILVYHAAKLKKNGMGLDELKNWVEEHKLNALHFFCVDDLSYFKKTGRVSAVAATLGTMLDLKPFLILTKEGKIIVSDKVKGKKKVVKYIADKVANSYVADGVCDDLLVILHCDENIEQAKALEAQITEKCKFNNVWSLNVGPVITCHCGPTVLAACLLGKEREV